MRKRLAAGALTAVMAAALFGASGASAATEFGDACFANETAKQSVTIYEAFAPENPTPAAAPAAGVITKWRVNLHPAAPFAVPTTLKVLHPLGPNSAQIVGEATQNVPPGGSSAETRIPVQSGDHLALFGPSAIGFLYCKLPADTAVIGGFIGPGGSVGATVPIVEEPADVRVPVTGFLEPDADKDGYGDETQDKCPQSAAIQTPCPAVTVDASSVAKKGSVIVLVSVNSPAPVTVAGTVKLGKGKPATLQGGTQTLAPGAMARFKLKFTKRVKNKLADLSPKQKLTLKISATATNVAGLVSTDNVNAKLKGQAK